MLELGLSLGLPHQLSKSTITISLLDYNYMLLTLYDCIPIKIHFITALPVLRNCVTTKLSQCNGYHHLLLSCYVAMFIPNNNIYIHLPSICKNYTSDTTRRNNTDKSELLIYQYQLKTEQKHQLIITKS